MGQPDAPVAAAYPGVTFSGTAWIMPSNTGMSSGHWQPAPATSMARSARVTRTRPNWQAGTAISRSSCSLVVSPRNKIQRPACPDASSGARACQPPGDLARVPGVPRQGRPPRCRPAVPPHGPRSSPNPPAEPPADPYKGGVRRGHLRMCRAMSIGLGAVVFRARLDRARFTPPRLLRHPGRQASAALAIRAAEMGPSR